MCIRCNLLDDNVGDRSVAAVGQATVSRR